MNCQNCGTQLPPEAKACPNCGTRTSASYADSGVSPYEPTQTSASGSFFDPMIAPPPPSTQYGSYPPASYSSHYGDSLPGPYEIPPYNVPPPPRRKVSPMILVILCLLVLLIVGASIGFVLLRNNQTKISTSPTATTSINTNTGTTTPNATATANAFYSLYDTDTSTLPTKDDPLSDNSKGLRWDEGQGCTFSGGAYHVSNPQSSSFLVCLAHASNFSDFLYQVQMTIVKGSYGSLIFRSDDSLSNFYIFRAGQDGVCTFAVYKNRADIEIKHSPSLAFKQGPNQTNLLAVIAQGSHLIFYVNAQYVFDVTDSSLMSGEIGLVAGSIGDPTTVIYNNAKLWAL